MLHSLLPLAAMLLSAESPLVLVGTTEIPSDTRFQGILVGGLSGLDRAPDGSYVAISDDRGAEGRPPRLYRMAIQAGGPEGVRVKIRSHIILRGRDGAPLPVDRATVDPEAVRVAPGGRLYWASEGIWSEDPKVRVQPAIVEADAGGCTLRDFAVPPGLLYHDGTTRGARPNGVFEGLALDTDARLYAITEAPLFDDLAQDAPLDAPAPLRLTQFDTKTGRAVAQYAMVVPDRRYGLTDLITDGPRTFLAVERALPFDAVRGAAVRIVRLRIPPDATSVLGRARLSTGDFVPLIRELLLDLAKLKPALRIDNIEGIARGPTLRDGRRTLVLLSDNNFNARQVTQLLLLAWRRRADRGLRPVSGYSRDKIEPCTAPSVIERHRGVERDPSDDHDGDVDAS